MNEKETSIQKKKLIYSLLAGAGVLLLAASPSRMYDGHGVILRD